MFPLADLLKNVEFDGSFFPGARFSKVPRTFRARKAIRKTTTCLFCKAGLLICCKGNKNNWKVTPSFCRYKENYVTRNTPEKFRDFRETGPSGEYLCFCKNVEDRKLLGRVPCSSARRWEFTSQFTSPNYFSGQKQKFESHYMISNNYLFTHSSERRRRLKFRLSF